MEKMGLSKFANVKIGSAARGFNLSGSERKRLSFTTKSLISIPLMFCDEPTTGLDASMAKSVVQAMQGMAANDTTILCTIHQPASQIFEMFDDILLLASGRLIYAGPIEDAMMYIVLNFISKS